MADEELALERDEQAEGHEGEAEEELSEDAKLMAELKEAVTVQREDLGGLRMKLTVTVPRETIEGRMSKEFAELKREAAIPGFRKGHAPIKLVEKRFATDVGQQLKSQMLGSGYLAAVEKEEIKPLGDPLVWVKAKEERIGEDGKPRNVEVDKLLPLDQALEHVSLPKEGPLTFSCELEVKPEFELPKLDKIPVKRPKIVIRHTDIDEAIARMRIRGATFQPVENGGVELNDLLYVDLKLSIDGEQITSEENTDIAARPMRIRGIPLPKLGEALKGKKIGGTVEHEVTVPDDHENNDFRGKKAQFEFAIREIKRMVMPPIDAEFLEDAGFESEAELRKAVREELESRLERTIRERMCAQIGEYLVEHTELAIPAGLSQRQTDRSVARRMIEMYRQGIPEAEIARVTDEMHSKARDQVVRDLKLHFVIEKIAEEREINISEEEMNTAIADIARRSGKRFDRVRDELSKGDGLTSLYLRIRDDKVLEYLLTVADVTEGEAGVEAETEEEPAGARGKSPVGAGTSSKPKAAAKAAAPKTEGPKKKSPAAHAPSAKGFSGKVASSRKPAAAKGEKRTPKKTAKKKKG
ncbi:MAG: trigger factor [Planctomycetota bacterium]